MQLNHPTAPEFHSVPILGGNYDRGDNGIRTGPGGQQVTYNYREKLNQVMDQQYKIAELQNTKENL